MEEEKLRERIDELENQLETLKSQVEGKEETSSDDENISRRDFLKKAGLGAAGLGTLAMTPASALQIKTSNDFTYTGSGEQYFKINNGGPVEVKNSNLDLNQNQLNGLVLEQTSSTPSNAVQGRFWYDTTDNEPKYHDGSNEQSFGGNDTTSDENDFGSINRITGEGTVRDETSSIEMLNDTGPKTLFNSTISFNGLDARSAIINIEIDGNTFTLDDIPGPGHENTIALPDIKYDSSLKITITTDGSEQVGASWVLYTK